jgi:hypothetical protein
MSSQHGDTQILVAESKSATARRDLKRVMEDVVSEQTVKKPK